MRLSPRCVAWSCRGCHVISKPIPDCSRLADGLLNRPLQRVINKIASSGRCSASSPGWCARTPSWPPTPPTPLIWTSWPRLWTTAPSAWSARTSSPRRRRPRSSRWRAGRRLRQRSSTAVGLARGLRKTPVISGIGFGFIGNRVFAASAPKASSCSRRARTSRRSTPRCGRSAWAWARSRLRTCPGSASPGGCDPGARTYADQASGTARSPACSASRAASGRRPGRAGTATNPAHRRRSRSQWSRRRSSGNGSGSVSPLSR
jgi:hypothetical protein